MKNNETKNKIVLINEYTERPKKEQTMIPLAYKLMYEMKLISKEKSGETAKKESHPVSIADKYSLSVQEAAEYYGIGEKRLRSLIAEHYNASFILEIGSHIRIKRRLFEEYLDQATAV